MKDENSLPKPGLIILFIGLTLVSFFLIISSFLQNDLWQDELYAMNHFVFVPWRTIITDYHSTNNHIAFDLVLKAYTQIFGMGNSCELLEHPFLGRVIPLLFTLFGIIYFYLQSKNYYGKSFSLIAVSILCSTIVFADFAVQLRGYSFSLMLTLIQFFSFLKISKDENRSGVQWLLLFLSTTSNLLCLPTAIYFSITLLLLSVIVVVSPTASRFFFKKEILKTTAIKIFLVLLMSIIPVLIYYRWLLNQRPVNELVSSFTLFSTKNLLQALAVFFHFTDYRIYFFALVAISFVRRIKQPQLYSNLNFPLFFFFFPFILYFIQGPIIVQRIFVPLIPVFVLIITAIIQDIFYKKNARWIYLICGANLLCLAFGYLNLVYRSKSDNRLSRHSQDLLHHYYLVNFNARSAVIKAKELQTQTSWQLYVLDDYGGTGIKYYLNCYGLNYENYAEVSGFKENNVIITNNKIRLESELLNMKREFFKLLVEDQQYQIYQLK